MWQHRYLPMTEQDQTEMLRVVGVSSIDDLFSDIPEVRSWGDSDAAS
jgi:glycine dehydrogenase subunit 1